MNRRSQIAHKQREKELLEKCFDLLAEKGLENTGMRDLCKACELSTNNSLYHYFGNKDNIVVEAASFGLERMEKAFFAVAIDETLGLEDFFHMVPGLVEKYQDDMSLAYQVAVSPRYRNRMVSYLGNLSERYDGYVEKISEKVDCNPDELRPLVYLFASVTARFMLFRDKKISKVQFDYVYRQFMNVIEKSL
jgi:AcrR family transcriptional regulator